MTQSSAGATSQLRWGIYSLLIALAVGNMAGRLLAVNSVNRSDLEKHVIRQDLQRAEAKLKERALSGEALERKLEDVRAKTENARRMQRPFLSANDRSRWMAVRALVEHGTYEIDDLIDRYLWNTIDMVQHRGRDGELHLYSSKPPLLITLLAGEYWLIVQVTGMTLETHPYLVGRLMLFTVNVAPLVLMFALIAMLVEKLGTTDWGRIFVVASATMGTLLIPFAVVLNNHIVAAASAAVALFAIVRIWCADKPQTRYYVLAGLSAAFTATCELPALALLALIAWDLLMRNARAWLIGFLPATALVALAFFGTNHAAHNCWTPPYMHKSSEDPAENWYDYTYTVNGVERESYWRDRQGIDRGEPSRATYTWHVLFGHHGIFSLTPLWLLSFAGIVAWLTRGNAVQQRLAWAVAILTIVCLVFFIGFRPQEDRNYGGMTSGFRWMFWFAPLWLTAMIPTADWLARSRLRQALALTLLTFSVVSASYPTWNPWTHPWLYHWLEYCGWQGFR